MRYLSVSEINSQIKALFSINFPSVFVEGEIGNLTKHQSGHYYFTLKDDSSSIKCILFKSAASKINFDLASNMNIQVEGNISVYDQRGEYQIICTKVLQSGIGVLAIKFEELKAKLKQKGYFDATFKKQIPRFPKKIALITSLSGAALQDMKSVASKRWNLVELVAIDTLVQGNEAKNTITQKIKFADKMNFDIIVLARGGGSLEDLWAFNEEIVANAIFNASTPIVSAIGHEIDYTLSDFVADLRAPTPSACIELILPDKFDWLLRLSDFLDNLNNLESKNLFFKKEQLNTLNSKLSFFKIDYKKIGNELLDLKKILLEKKNQNIVLKSKILNNLSSSLNHKYKNLHPLKLQQLKYLNQRLLFHMQSFLKDKINSNISYVNLNARIFRFIKYKQNQLFNLNSILNVKNPKDICKKGFVQITLNDEIKNLEEIPKDSAITLSNGVIVRDAKVL